MKNVIKAIISVFLILTVAIIPKMFYPSLNIDKITDEMYKRREKYYYGVITLWQIDCFEGGTGSRANWLKEICKDFERRNNGVYINVESISLELANKMLSSGQKKPDIISYGMGLNIDESKMEKLTSQAPNMVKNVSYETAIPWCMGAYFMFGDGDKEAWGTDGKIVETKKAVSTVYSVGIPKKEGYTSAIALERNCNNSFNDKTSLIYITPQELFEAYNYSKKVNRMIGTQRDFYRLASAASREKARNGKISYLGYTDLFQYISIIKCDNVKKLYTMNSFVQFLLEDGQQKQLCNIGMFPVTSACEPSYTNSDILWAWEKIRTEGIFCSSYLFSNDEAFIMQENTLKKLQNMAE